MNFLNNATEEDVRGGFIKGWRQQCKGLTVFRDKSHEHQILQSLI
jgi:ribonucleotide reductase alpha subunit